MTLDLLENTQMAKILNFNLTQRLLERFFSLGLYKFKTIKKIESSLGVRLSWLSVIEYAWC